jgi:hypothetical protein
MADEEFEARKLDIGIIQAVELSKEITEVIKISEFERATADQFTETIWRSAFEEKAKGKTNRQIFESLLTKNISEDYAYMLIASMEPRARELVDSYSTEIIVGWTISIGGGLLLIFTIYSALTLSFLIGGVILLIGGGIRLVRSYKNKGKFQIIIQNIETEKEKKSNCINKDYCQQSFYAKTAVEFCIII